MAISWEPFTYYWPTQSINWPTRILLNYNAIHDDGMEALLALTHWGRKKMAAIFPDDIFKCIFLIENVWISIKSSLRFVPKGPINTIPALLQIMAWHRPGDKPLSEPMMVSVLKHIYVTRPQWVKPATGGFPSHRGTSNVEFWQFYCCQPGQNVEHTIELNVIWDAMTLMWRHCNHQVLDQSINNDLAANHWIEPLVY